jgi:prepilin-type N-terminal cleavage/methylation domain-containing protein
MNHRNNTDRKLGQRKLGQKKLGQKKLGFSLLELSIVLVIISALMVAVIKGSDLISRSRIAAAAQTTTKSPVPLINGLVLWYETTLPDSFISSEVRDNGSISTWNDISQSNPSNAKNMLQPLAANQPTYKESGLNNLPTLFFDGVSDYMANAANVIDTSTLSPQSQNTIFIVMNYISGAVFFKIQASNSNRIGLENSGGNIRWDFPNDTTGILGGTSSIIQNTIILTLDKNSTTQSIFINGTLNNSKANTLALAAFKSSITIGADSGGGLPSQMYISELIIYNRSLSTQERRDVERYLSDKYQITVS